MEEETKPKNKSIAVKIVGMLIFGVIVVVAILQQAILPTHEIVPVTGQGRVAMKPDMAIINLNVTTLKAVTSADALDQTTEKMNKVKNALMEMGLEENDWQATGYAFNPQYEDGSVQFGGMMDMEKSASPKAAKIVGYNGFQQITVKVRGINDDPQAIDRLIERVSREGVTQVGLVKFVATDIEKLKQEAREKAVVDAKQKANMMSDVAGIKLGKIKSWTENTLTVPGQVYGEGMYMYDNNYFSFPNETNLVSQPSNQTEVILEVTLQYEAR